MFVRLADLFCCSFSLVAEIWGLASKLPILILASVLRVSVSLPRFGGWRGLGGDPPPGAFLRFSLVAEIWGLASDFRLLREGTEWMFQSRCRDLGVGEKQEEATNHPMSIVSVSLPRFGGWRDPSTPSVLFASHGFSLVAEIWGLARVDVDERTTRAIGFSLVAEIWGLARNR